MYCSSCGSAVPQGLNYCNRCGAKVNESKVATSDKPSEAFPESLVWAIVAVLIAGIGVIIGLMAVMKEVVRFDLPIILAITIVSFALLLTIESVLIWMLLSSRRMAKKLLDNERLRDYQQPRQAEPRVLPEARVLAEPVPSVTEHTTRAFEPIYSERKSNTSE